MLHTSYNPEHVRLAVYVVLLLLAGLVYWFCPKVRILMLLAAGWCAFRVGLILGKIREWKKHSKPGGDAK